MALTLATSKGQKITSIINYPVTICSITTRTLKGEGQIKVTMCSITTTSIKA